MPHSCHSIYYFPTSLIICVFNICIDYKPHKGRDLNCVYCLLYPRALEHLGPGIEGRLRTLLGRGIQKSHPVGEALYYSTCNFLSQKTSASPFSPAPTPTSGAHPAEGAAGRDSRQGPFSCPQSQHLQLSGLRLPGRGLLGSSWRRGAGLLLLLNLLDGFLGFTPLLFSGLHPAPGTEGTRPEKCS